MITFLLICYFSVAFVFGTVFTMALVEELKKNGESQRARNLAARLILALVWPILIPVGIVYAFRLVMKKRHL